MQSVQPVRIITFLPEHAEVLKHDVDDVVDTLDSGGRHVHADGEEPEPFGSSTRATPERVYQASVLQFGKETPFSFVPDQVRQEAGGLGFVVDLHVRDRKGQLQLSRVLDRGDVHFSAAAGFLENKPNVVREKN